jgi:hypothetical protein
VHDAFGGRHDGNIDSAWVWHHGLLGRTDAS